MKREKKEKAAATGKAHAILVINKAAEMSLVRKVAIANWLRELANDLIVNGGMMSKRFTARYMVSTGK